MSPKILIPKIFIFTWSNYIGEVFQINFANNFNQIYIVMQPLKKTQRSFHKAISCLTTINNLQVVTLNADEHERNLLDHLNALFTSAPGGNDYDYGEDLGPFQVSIPINPELGLPPLPAQDSSVEVNIIPSILKLVIK